jgi:ribulose-phosphate 3-epimerase
MPRTARTVPAILTDSPATLEKLVHMAESFTDYAQFDLMDGHFVPSRSITSRDIIALKPKINWEAHLMVLQPEDCLEDFKKAGAKKIVFHFEAVASPEKMIELIRKQDMKVGLAINPETAIPAFKNLVPEVDSVLFMAVHPGFYGAKFLPETLDKIREFRKTYFKTEVGLDGGVKENNIQDIVRSGVDVVYVGSAIFLQPDPAAAFRHLSALVHSATI